MKQPINPACPLGTFKKKKLRHAVCLSWNTNLSTPKSLATWSVSAYTTFLLPPPPNIYVTIFQVIHLLVWNQGTSGTASEMVIMTKKKK